MLTRFYPSPLVNDPSTLGYQYLLQSGSIFTERNQYIGRHPTSTLRCAVLGASFAGLSWLGICCRWYKVLFESTIVARIMHPPLTLHRHPMCADIIEEFQKCHLDHPAGKFFGKCTDLKIKLDSCFRQEKAVKRKANFEESKKLKERLRAYRKESADSS